MDPPDPVSGGGPNRGRTPWARAAPSSSSESRPRSTAAGTPSSASSVTSLLVTADIYADGHDLLDAVLQIRAEDEAAWHETPMRLIENDRWSARIPLPRAGRHRYTIEAWRDAWGTGARDSSRRSRPGSRWPPSWLRVGCCWAVAMARAEARGAARGRGAHATRRCFGAAGRAANATAAARPRRRTAPRGRAAAPGPQLVDAPRPRAPADGRPRACAVRRLVRALPALAGPTVPATHGDAPGTLTWRLADIAAMGFDVVYLPPIHPIGRTNRKGQQQHPRAGPGRPGQPVGHRRGGGRPQGGRTRSSAALADFDALPGRGRGARHRGRPRPRLPVLRPTTPTSRSTRSGSGTRPDGTIKYAENPPKNYQDIYPFDFDERRDGARRSGRSWLDVVLLLGRARRAHLPGRQPAHQALRRSGTGSSREVQREHPDVLFLSEAFTRPKMMQALAKVGFTQSYTYFTWRDSAAELREYLTELTQTRDARVLPRQPVAQHAGHPPESPADRGRPAFVIRGRAGRHAVDQLRHLLRLRAVREPRALGEREEYLDSREVRDPRQGLGRAGQHQAR